MNTLAPPETGLILRDYSRFSVAIGPEAEEEIERALSAASLLGRVRNPEMQEQVVAAQTGIRRVLRLMEACRKAVKNPVLAYAKEIDDTVRKAVEPLEAEDLRLSDHLAEFQRAEILKAREAERIRLMELARIEREKQEEQQRIQRELEAKAAREKDESRKQRLVEDAVRQQREIEDRTKQAMEAAGPANVPAKAKGQTVREELRFEVTDIWLLARTSPGLVRIEENRQEITEVLKRLAPMSPGGVPQIPGLRVWSEVVSGVRLGREKGVIDV